MSDSNLTLRGQALEFHKKKPSGKIQVNSSKKIETEHDLSLAYSPGVAFPCQEIEKNPDHVFDYTSRGNLVAVITDGTAVLGLGNIGPLAAKPVMEGKAILFKHFAGIDVFDLELKTKSVDDFINVCRSLEPSFGGINLEDISAPACFEIEKRLEEELSIPVFHDDQHGTAIITCAALINACLVTGKKIQDVKIVFNGAGAAAIACGNLLQSMGVPLDHITMCDSRGVIYKNRKENMNPYKEAFAQETQDRSLKEAIRGADVFIGLSCKDILTEEMVRSMSDSPFVFAMANPHPEIHPHLAKKANPKAIVATGRADFPNQVNNVLGFPSIFRAALDTRATHINQEMKIAAVQALAELAREPIPESVSLAYGGEHFKFGSDYIIPKPFDPRVVVRVAPRVAQAAVQTGVARRKIKDWEAYALSLESLQGAKQTFIRKIIRRIQTHSKNKPKIIFPEGESVRILKAIQASLQSFGKENLYHPILVGDEKQIRKQINDLGLSLLKDIEIQNPLKSSRSSDYARQLYELRKHKKLSLQEAQKHITEPDYFASLSLQMSHVDGLITGASQNYEKSIRPILKVIGCGDVPLASGMNVILVKDKIFIFSDTTVNIDPSAEQVAYIVRHACDLARMLLIEPRVALLSFSNFVGQKESPKKMKQALEILKKWDSHVIVDGEMQADTAVNPEIMKNIFPNSRIKNGANILIFPNLDSGNIAYKLVQQIGSGEVIGPLLMGVQKPVDIVQRTGGVDDVVNIIWFNLLKIQSLEKK